MAKREVPKSVRASLYIDGKPAEASIKNVEQVTRSLRRELNGLTIGTDEWNSKMRQVKQNTAYVSAMRREINNTGGAMAFLRTEIGKFGAIAAGYLGFQFVTSQFHNIIQANAQLSDSLADVRKTTNMTEEQVRDLNRELRDIDTRTARRELLDLAYAAGKLGITAKDDILEFVRAADQINVALGKELGGAEEAITAIGKLTDIFRIKETYGIEQAMLKVGSVLNELGMAGTATERYMVNFTERLAGIAPTANISAQSVMAIAATMDELGQRVESSATAIGQFIVRMGRDIPRYAKIAGVSIQEFSDMLRRDGAEALMAVLRNANSLGGGVELLAENMGMLEIAGARGIAALGVLSNNTETYTARLELANKAFEEGTSVTEEFAIKNENLAAKLDKLSKEFNRLVASSKVSDFFMKIIEATTSTVNWLNENIRAIGSFIKIMIVAAVAWGSYRAAIALANTALVQHLLLGRSNVAIMVLQRNAGIALAGMKALLTGNIVRATAAMRALNLTMTLNPFGAVVAVVAAAAAGFMLLSRNVSAAQKAQEDINRTNQQAVEETKAQDLIVKEHIKTLQDENAHRSRKLTAVKALREIMPDVLKDYKDEEIMAGKAANAIAAHADALLYQAQIRAKTANLDRIVAENMEYNSKRQNEGFFAGVGRFMVGDANYDYFSGLDRQSFEDRITRQNLAVKDLMKTTEEYNRRFGQQGQTADPLTPSIGTPAGDDKEAKRKTDEIQKQQEALTDWLLKNDHDLLLNMMESAQREMAIITKKYEDRRALAHGDADLLRQLEEQEAEENRQFMLKQAEQNRKDHEKFFQEKADAQKRITEAGMTERERELYDVARHYELLTELARQYGIDTTLLAERREEALAAIREKHHKEDGKEEREKQEKRKEFAIHTAEEIASTIFTIGQNRRQAESDARLADLQRRRNSELDNENLTQEQRKRINERYDKLEKEEKRKAFVADQRAAIAQATIQTALAVTKQIGNWYMMAAAAVAGAAQVAVIASQKPPQYAKGGYSDEDPEGYIGNATLFRKTASGRPFIAGEAGREWIAPNWMVDHPRYSNLIGMLEAARKEKRMYAGLGASSSEGSVGATGGTGYDFMRLEAKIDQLNQTMATQGKKPIVFDYQRFEDYVSDIEFARKNQSG